MTSMRTTTFCNVFYVCCLQLYTYSLWYCVYHANDNTSFFTYKGYGGQLKYLTIWNLCLQAVYYGVCFFNSFAGDGTPTVTSTSAGCRLHRLRDILHTTLAFPVGMFVVVTFWALYAVDRELVYPKTLDLLIPPWLNHIMHTVALPLLVAEKMMVYHHHPRRRNGLIILSAFALTYLSWIMWVAYKADLWVYPVLKVMQTHQRVVFIAVLLLLFVIIYLLGEALTKWLWGKEKTVMVAAGKKKQ